MDPFFTWMLLGGAAFIIVLINLVRAMSEEHQGWQTLLFASLSCGALAVLAALQMIQHSVEKGYWDYAKDTVPSLAVLCSKASKAGILLNLLAIWLHLRAEETRKGVEPDGKS